MLEHGEERIKSSVARIGKIPKAPLITMISCSPVCALPGA